MSQPLTKEMAAVVDAAVVVLRREEGWRSRPYYDSEGYPTVGFGFKIGSKHAPLPSFKLPAEAGEAWLKAEVTKTVWALHEMQERNWEVGVWLRFSDTARATILVSMAYQMGVRGLLGFPATIEYLRDGDHDSASEEMLDSLWAREQSAKRARRHSNVMRTGLLHTAYPALFPVNQI